MRCMLRKYTQIQGRKTEGKCHWPEPLTMLLIQLFLELPHMPPRGQQFGNSDPKI